MKKTILMIFWAAILVVASPLFADTQNANGYTWTYYINGETAVIYGSYSGSYTPAISPLPTGSVTIPSTLGGKSIISIGTGAFYNCTGMTSITIPTNVTSISSSAFSGCSGLESMTLPFVGSSRGNSGSKYDVFGYIFGTTKYTGGNCIKQYYSSSGSESYCIPSSLKSVTITDETVIGYGAFNNCRDITSVVICSGVTKIQAYAFWECYGLKSVTIPNSVLDINVGAFTGCSGLTSVKIPDDITSIKSAVFYNCSGLKRLEIPYSVTSIESEAFSDCYGLTNVTIPNNVTNIGSYAFYNCKGLASVTIPDSVMNIGKDAFSACKDSLYVETPCGVRMVDGWAIGIGKTYSNDLDFTGVRGIASYALSHGPFTNIRIPNSVKSIGEFAFAGCTSVKSLTIDAGTTIIGSGSFSGCSGLTSVTIGNGVTSIGSSAFLGCSRLSGVTIPDSVTDIGDDAFRDCSGLTSVIIGNSVTNIGSYAFRDCSGLTRVTIPDGVTSIDEGVFYNCNRLANVTMPLGIANIGANAFYNCGKLRSMTIGGVVTNIGNNAFCGCNGLRSVTVSQYVCTTGLSSVFPDAYESIENLIILDGTTIIEDEAFHGCRGLSNVAIGNSVTKIGYQAFSGCSSLTGITIPSSVNSIGSYAFSDCDGLKRVTIDDMASWCRISFAEASANPIYYAHNLYLNNELVTELIIPDSVTSISEHAFYGCTNVMTIVIPSSVTSIGTNAFTCNSRLVSIIVASDNANFTSANGLLLSKDGKNLIQGVNNESVAIPTGVTSIGHQAFLNCSRIINLTMPNSLTNIIGNAFDGCSGLTNLTVPQSVCSSKLSDFFPSAYRRITSVIIADGVTNIGSYAFSNCGGVKSVTMPKSVTSIESHAFSGCGGLIEITLPFIGAQRGNSYTADSVFGYIFGTSSYTGGIGTYQACGSDYSGSDYTYYIPETLRSVTITDETIVGFGAFVNCSRLTVVTIPDSVTSIGGNAFDGCSGLTSVTIPDSVKSIDGRAFASCSGLTCVTIGNSVTNIGDSAFGRCSGLTSVTIPDSVKSIGRYAFDGCSGLTSVTISDSVKSIGCYAFGGCSDLLYDADSIPGVSLVDGWAIGSTGSISGCLNLIAVRGIGDDAFYGCSGLTSVTIGNGVTSIGSSAFRGCSGLTSVTISDSVKSIGGNAFRDCSELTSVMIGNGVLSIGDWAFYGCGKLTSFTIPDGVTSIGGRAFARCSGLTNVTVLGSAPRVGSYAFSSVNSSCVASVSPRSTGWGVGEGEKWNGLTLRYWPEVLTVVASDAEVGEIVETFADKEFATQVTNKVEYDAFRAWVNGNNLHQPTVIDSKNTWLSYALGTDALIGKEITSNDVQIVGFDMVDGGALGTTRPASFAFEVAIDGVNIGGGSVAEAILKENLKKVLGIEGAKSLSSGAFSSDNIDITFDTPVDGKAKFTVSPPNDAGNSFFMRVKVK